MEQFAYFFYFSVFGVLFFFHYTLKVISVYFLCTRSLELCMYTLLMNLHCQKKKDSLSFSVFFRKCFPYFSQFGLLEIIDQKKSFSCSTENCNGLCLLKRQPFSDQVCVPSHLPSQSCPCCCCHLLFPLSSSLLITYPHPLLQEATTTSLPQFRLLPLLPPNTSYSVSRGRKQYKKWGNRATIPEVS